ncbi:PLDc N-terminal domain-containing protein [Echinicola marina]|uniref:PLDc N-terminal domain-containing protein n=1 Tax=Echinicola marina TaxID=2859768 RepID=UPI001CF69DF9|nr:PLDc N-terminal domain-containing protein [Echinicola marina]UCS94920.1 PLDc N-terminal domain-containing protein [Echinicola marina]
MLGLGSIGIIIYVFTVFDVINSRFHKDKDKVTWLIIVIILPGLGTLLWFLIGRGRAVL